MEMPGRKYASESYRYDYQGQFAEKDGETGLHSFELRQWDARIARWNSTDPYGQYFSPYMGMGNNPISLVDPDGGFAGGGDPPISHTMMSEITLTASGGGISFGSGLAAIPWSSIPYDHQLPSIIRDYPVNPSGGVLRGMDDFGSGHYGASRESGKRSHKGIDITTTPGQNLVSPVTGKAKNFVGNTSGKPMLDITPSNSVHGIEQVRILYVNRPKSVNAWQSYDVVAGQTSIGTASNLVDLGYPNGITQHIHLQVRIGGEWVDPTPYFFGH
jgi:RHS repeat-associated protein